MKKKKLETHFKKNKHYAVDRKHNVILSRGISVVLSVCGLCSNLATMEVSCPMKNGRVLKLSTKGRLSRTRGPFLLLPSSQEELLCLLAFSCIVLSGKFPLVPLLFCLALFLEFIYFDFFSLNSGALPTGSLIWVHLAF